MIAPKNKRFTPVRAFLIVLCVASFTVTNTAFAKERKAGDDPCATLYTDHMTHLAEQHLQKLIDDKAFRSSTVTNERMKSMDPDETFHVVLAYLDKAVKQKKLTKKLKSQLILFRSSWCQYQKDDVPELTLNFDALAESLGVRLEHGSSGLAIKEELNGKLFDDPDSYADNVPWISVLHYSQAYLRRTGRYTLYDQPFINRLAFLLETLPNRIGMTSSLLELGAGRGTISKALREKGLSVTAADNFSDQAFDTQNNPEGSFRVVKSDVYEEHYRWKDYGVVFSFFLPYSDSVISRYHHRDEGRGLVLKRQLSITAGRINKEDQTTIYKKGDQYFLLMYRQLTHFPIPNIYGRGAVNTILIISDYSDSHQEMTVKAHFYDINIKQIEQQLQKMRAKKAPRSKKKQEL